MRRENNKNNNKNNYAKHSYSNTDGLCYRLRFDLRDRLPEQRSWLRARLPAQPAPAVATPPPTPSAAPAPPVNESVVRIKAGVSTPFTDSSGNVWQPDQGFDGGDVISRDPGTAIANTKDAALYLSEHYAMNSFSCNVPNGKYIAKLHFAETFEGVTGAGQRVFSFNVHGPPVQGF